MNLLILLAFAQMPFIDLGTDTKRQVEVDREPGQYLGHPTTVLLEDGKTILTVYPKGHGKTWPARIPVPDNRATPLETPTIHRVIDAKGKRRLIVFSGLYAIRMAVSENGGATWSPLNPIGKFGGIVAMSSVVRLRDGRYMAFFHDDGRFFRNEGKRGPFVVYQTTSAGGGLTWSEPVPVASHAQAQLCEPGVFRSPDGKQLAMLPREDSRKFNSFISFSDDEGATWSAPREVPGALTGDRRQGAYVDDGRLFITFRDMGRDSATKGDWAAWVGRYEELVTGKEGQYRVRLMKNHKAADWCYPGVEHLKDDTIVTTTYGHWTPNEEAWIATARLKLKELR
jgi:hypothetical protein